MLFYYNNKIISFNLRINIEERNRKELNTLFKNQDKESLTVAEVRQQEDEQRRELERDEQPRLRRPPKCSDCGVIGHNRRRCTGRLS